MLLLGSFALALAACDSFDFYGLLSGRGTQSPTGVALTISPISANVQVGMSCSFTASGGTPPYRFSVLVPAAGTIDASTGLYTAPAAPASDTVEVDDAAGGFAQARVVAVQ